jgi:alkylation response protein AidB-like acyl-CoA dehydrogenase
MAEHRSMSEEELRERTRALLDEVHPERSDSVTFRRAQYDHGLAWVHFPEGYGGLGLGPKLNLVVQDEISNHSQVVHHDPPASLIGIGMGAPVVLTYGSEEMKKELLPRIFSGEDIWCQMFSEPGAGSDVAGLATREDLLTGIAAGRKIVSVAHAEPNGRWDLAGIELRARSRSTRCR